MDGILRCKDIQDADGEEANNFRKALLGPEMFTSIKEMLVYLETLQAETESHGVVKNIQTKFKSILVDNRVGII